MEQDMRDTPHHGYGVSLDAPHKIEPCATRFGEYGQTISSMFHLLDCGHIIAIDGTDRSCGSNCQNSVDYAMSHFSHNIPISTIPAITDILSSNKEKQRQDPLYCEVCHGIPTDNYKFHKPPKDHPAGSPFTPRRCLALTRGEIVAALRIPDDEVEILLARPFPSPNYEAHNLYCGHRVWCASSRPCARNCRHDQSCRDDVVAYILPKYADVIFCQECVARAEMVHLRYEGVALKLALENKGEE